MISNHIESDWFIAILALALGVYATLFEWISPKYSEKRNDFLYKSFKRQLGSTFTDLSKPVQLHVKYATHSLLDRAEPSKMFLLPFSTIIVPIVTMLRPIIQREYPIPFWVPVLMFLILVVQVYSAIRLWNEHNDLEKIKADPDRFKGITLNEIGRLESKETKERYHRYRIYLTILANLPAVEVIIWAIVAPHTQTPK